MVAILYADTGSHSIHGDAVADNGFNELRQIRSQGAVPQHNIQAQPDSIQQLLTVDTLMARFHA